MYWDLTKASLPKKEVEKPILKKREKPQVSIKANGMDCVLERPKKVEKPILKNKSKSKGKHQTEKTNKKLESSNPSNEGVSDFKGSSSPGSEQKATKKEKRKKKESFAERRRRLNLERLRDEARSNHHKKIPEPIRPYFESYLDAEPSVYESIMDERRAEGMGYGGAR